MREISNENFDNDDVERLEVMHWHWPAGISVYAFMHGY